MSVQLRLDPSSLAGDVNPLWTFGGNTCHMALWLRADVRRHLEMARRELGFSYARCHGGLNDDMGVVRDDGTFSFETVDRALDAVLALGMKPFFELSSMPKALARDDTHICKYEFVNSPPRDWSKWYDLVKALMTHLAGAYGIDELRTWYFEVWNEPDIAFWRGTQEEYFRLYDLAARAVKETDRALRVGGPATARTRWIDEFLAHVTRPSDEFGLECGRCDFVSTHAYPSDIEFCDSDVGGVTLTDSNIMARLFGEVRRKVDAALGEGFPVICGEWNSSAGPLAANHDECNNAAYVAKTMHELSAICQGSLYWDISDIYEECGFHYEPFHGGYGLVTVNDVPKSAFHAFRLLAEHAGALVGATFSDAIDGLGCLASRVGSSLRALVYYYREPHAEERPAVRVRLEGLPDGATAARAEYVEPGRGSAYETYRERGRPPYANRELLEALEEASTTRIADLSLDAPEITVAQGTIVQVTVDLGS